MGSDPTLHAVFIVRRETLYKPSTGSSQDETVEKFVPHGIDAFPISPSKPLSVLYDDIKRYLYKARGLTYVDPDTPVLLQMYQVKGLMLNA